MPLLQQWSAPGKPIESRTASIRGLAILQKDNKDITKQIASYLTEPHFPVRMSAIFSLGSRGDATAIPALEALLKSGDLSIEMAPMIRGQIERLKKPAGVKPGPQDSETEEGFAEGASASEKAPDISAVVERLDKLEHLVQEMNERLKSFESRLPPPKP